MQGATSAEYGHDVPEARFCNLVPLGSHMVFCELCRLQLQQHVAMKAQQSQYSTLFLS